MRESSLGLRLAFFLILLILPVVVAGCYAGSLGLAFGIVALSEDGGGSKSSPPVVGFVEVTDTKRFSRPRISPAVVRFRLTDGESDPVDVEILAVPPAAVDPSRAPKPVLLTGDDPNLVGLDSSPEGVIHEKAWDFAEQFGDHFQRGFTLRIRVADGVSFDEVDVDIGNDPPAIMSVVKLPVEDPERDEVVGIAVIGITVADSSDDEISVRVEYDVGGDESWPLARPASQSRPQGEELPPDFMAISGVRASSAGADLDFFWDVVADLGRTEREVRLRFKAHDGVS